MNENDKVLEIGTGSGYQSAVLQELGASVFTIERQEALYSLAKKKLKELGYQSVRTYFGDGYKGLRDEAPFDRILITAAASGIPQHLLEQLKTGGIMVVPLNGNIQKMVRITKLSEAEVKMEDFGDFLFVPMLHGTEPE